MAPAFLLLNHFISGGTKIIPVKSGIRIDHCNSLNKVQLKRYLVEPFGITDPPDNSYVHAGFKNLSGLAGSVFVYENTVYKIKTVCTKNIRDRIFNTIDGSVDTTVGTILRSCSIFIIEEHTDPYVEELKARFEKIKQSLLVCTDRIEDLGGLKMLAGLRKEEKRWMLEDLV